MSEGFREVIGENESLLLFIQKIADFDKVFCEEMRKGSDYTIRLEVHGNKSKVLHIRIYHDSIDRPSGKKKGDGVSDV